jgi:hypothetical protein
MFLSPALPLLVPHFSTNLDLGEIMANRINHFHWDDQNGPQLNGTVGSATNLLRECLVEGFGATGVSITGITRASQTATATVSAKDMFKLKVGTWVTISGANESEYNGVFQVATIASATTFTYTVAGSPATPATGTIVFHKKLGITSITRSGTTATATTTQADANRSTGEYYTIVGANESDYNGTFQITMLTPTTFTYQVENSPTTPATGTITHYKSGLQWTKEFENAAGTITAFKNLSVSPLGQHYLRVDDSGTVTTAAAKECIATGFETMNHDSYGTNWFPNLYQITPQTAAAFPGVNWRKSTSADTTIREWHMVGDGRFFTLVPNTESATPTSNSAGRCPWVFGECNPIKAGDTDACVLSGFATHNTAGTPSTSGHGGGLASSAINIAGGNVGTSYVAASFFARASSGVTGSCSCVPASAIGGSGSASNSTTCGSTSSVVTTLRYPHPVDGGLWVTPLLAAEGLSSTPLRATVPGIYLNMHLDIPAINLDEVQNVIGLAANAKLLCLYVSPYTTANSFGIWFFDLTGPWL